MNGVTLVLLMKGKMMARGMKVMGMVLEHLVTSMSQL
jgi:hypothetical protein